MSPMAAKPTITGTKATASIHGVLKNTLAASPKLMIASATASAAVIRSKRVKTHKSNRPAASSACRASRASSLNS
jgi:hypothetical protein